MSESQPSKVAGTKTAEARSVGSGWAQQPATTLKVMPCLLRQARRVPGAARPGPPHRVRHARHRRPPAAMARRVIAACALIDGGSVIGVLTSLAGLKLGGYRGAPVRTRRPAHQKACTAPQRNPGYARQCRKIIRQPKAASTGLTVTVTCRIQPLK